MESRWIDIMNEIKKLYPIGLLSLLAFFLFSPLLFLMAGYTQSCNFLKVVIKMM